MHTSFTLSSPCPYHSPSTALFPLSWARFATRILNYKAILSMPFSLTTMSAPTTSLLRAFSQFGRPQHPIEEYEPKVEAVHRKRGRSLSTPSLNTREWHQFRMLDATTPHLGPCDPMPSGRPRSASYNPSPVIPCVGPSLDGRGYEQVECLWEPVEITKPSESPAIISDEQAVATEEQASIDHGPKHLIKGTNPNAGLLPPTGRILESLLKRRKAPRCFFSLAELDAISSFEDFPDDGGYQPS